MWAEEVNRQLQEGRRPERVDHRSLAAQREEAVQKGQAEKAAELDRVPQVKLGWKVVQMERRGVGSDRGNQLRQVGADNVQRKTAVVDIGQLRAQLVQRQAEEAVRRQTAEQKKLLEEVETVFRGKGPLHREATLKRWRYLATKEIPDIANARALWEQDQWDPDAKAWRETRKTVEWETNQVVRAGAAVAEWHRQHPVQSLALRTGLKKPAAELQRLDQTHAENIRFLEGSQRRLAELEQAWPKKRLVYVQQLEREGEEIIKAKRFLGVIDAYPEHFQKFWEREDAAWRQRGAEDRSRDLDRGGYSR
jgi:hypothetical protein